MARSMNSYQTQLPSTLITTAQYQEYGTRLSGVLRGALARTADTGQVNWATVSSVPGNQVIRDYEVFAFTDALQATKPIYIRLDWGYNTTGFYTITQLWVGTATNGAGTLSGLQIGVPTAGTGTGTATQLQTQPGAATLKSFLSMTSASGVSQTRTAYASSDGSYLLFFANFQQAGQAGTTSDSIGGFVVERTRDADGTPNGNGYSVWQWTASTDQGVANSSSFVGQQMRSYDLSQANPYLSFQDSNYGAAVPPGVQTTSIVGGGPAQAFPIYGSAPQPQGASKALMVAYTADLPRMGQITLTHYGQPSQWISCAAAQPVQIPYLVSPGGAAFRNGYSLLFRWE